MPPLLLLLRVVDNTPFSVTFDRWKHRQTAGRFIYPAVFAFDRRVNDVNVAAVVDSDDGSGGRHHCRPASESPAAPVTS
ncbi:hypothetical protein Hdeb2414_s0011g00364831 [Helianthus debilis subsp. tardiflorus]